MATGRRFNLAVVIDGERGPDGRPMGRAVAESTFHHFADYNWDLGSGAPSFVTEPPGTQIKADPSRMEVFMVYVRNLAVWLHPQRTGASALGTCGFTSVGRLNSLRTVGMTIAEHESSSCHRQTHTW
jgi:hypothetical protein